jgi:uncharacterized C2H2 Zn-finger protein
MVRKYIERVNLNCPVCKKAFGVLPSRLAKAKAVYCGKDCANIAQTTSERFEFTCEECNVVFKNTKDHGADRRFCSRVCFRAKATRDLIEKECAQCGDVFKPNRSEHTDDKINKFCSKKCYGDAQKSGEERACLNCSNLFYTNLSHNNVCCSIKCKSEHFRGALAPAWKNGQFVTEATGHKFVAFERPDRVSKYVAEHRMVVMREIGRLLERWEYVIHINNVPDDNRPENLYVCGTNSQFSKMRNGSLPWPKKSNLRSYK